MARSDVELSVLAIYHLDFKKLFKYKFSNTKNKIIIKTIKIKYGPKIEMTLSEIYNSFDRSYSNQ